MFSFVGYFGLGRPPARAQNSRKKLRLRREYSSANRSPAPAHRDPLYTKFHLACRRRGAFCKGITCTPARRGPTFVRAKVGKTRSRGTDSPLTNPFQSLAVLDTNDAKHRPYCAQIRSQGSRRRICPLPVPLPRSGGGAVWANSCLFKFRSRQRDFLRLTPRPIGSPHPNRRDPLSLQNRATNPSFSSPIKPTIYANITHKSPIL